MCRVTKAFRARAGSSARTKFLLKRWARLRTIFEDFGARRALAKGGYDRNCAVHRSETFPSVERRMHRRLHGLESVSQHFKTAFAYWSVHGVFRHDDNQGAREVSRLGGSRYGYRRRPILRGQRNLSGVRYSAGQSATISLPRFGCVACGLSYRSNTIRQKKRLRLYRNQESLDWRERTRVVRPYL